MTENKNGAVSADEVVDAVKSEAADRGREAMKKAEDAKAEAAKGLNSFAEKIRREARENGGSEEDIERADAMADRVESAAQYLKNNSIEDIREDAEEKVRENAFAILGVVFFVGMFLGFLVGMLRPRDRD